MDVITKIENWGEHHHPAWMDIVRIALGVFLIYKGVDFLRNMSDLISLMTANNSNFGDFAYILAGHYAAGAHILGGIFLAVGLFTRAACIFQIPVLLGALFFLGTNPDMLRPYSEMFLTVMVLLLLVYFLIAGNGPLAVKLPDERKQ